ncbi:MAG TPA: MBL fold metallo-hydrolase, partial [Polyangiaceae bacterium]|nr:MBL fold metallo-hydrolase [Polyangiaceae bacterium]
MRLRPCLSALVLLAGAPALAGCGSTLPPAPPHAFVAAAPASPPMQLCWVEFATNEKPGGYGLAGSSGRDRWPITYSGLLVRHPRGDLLIDAGNSLHFDEEKKTAGFFSEILLGLYPGSGERVASAPAALARAGEAPAGLKAIVLTHVHADHAGGALDLPGVPIVLSIDELNYVRRAKGEGGFDVVKAQGEAIERRAQPVRFARAPYENFDQSHDYFGDGSVVFVPLAGHTPGSMGVFVNRS